jgi:hypothetical protein
MQGHIWWREGERRRCRGAEAREAQVEAEKGAFASANANALQLADVVRHWADMRQQLCSGTT